LSNKKIKILTLSDHPLSPSGVGTQTRYIVEGMLQTGRYEFFSLAGALKHEDYNVVKTEEWGDNWTILPVDGYGNQDLIRSIIRTEKPDILWFMTDPRFWGFLWDIENEIRSLMPMLYYHVWDNYPYPTFNKVFYDSNDKIITISKVTDDFVKNVSPTVDTEYLPHSVDTNIFKAYDKSEVKNFKLRSFPDEKNLDKMYFFWNNRNARRKQSGSLMYWFKDFLDEVGHENACLIMHTDPKDPHGQDLEMIIKELGLDNGQIMISTEKYPPNILAMMYNICDCTINISDAEGFGLATLESLACETPIIVNMTGGLQEQVTDGKEWFGIGIEPCSKAIIGSQQVPYIYEDRISKEDFVNALLEFYNTSAEERKQLGKKGREHVLKNYNFENYIKRWDEIFVEAHKKYGSWNNRKNYKSWTFEEVA
jgi:glycosyltransferase involved in cell wall biosynthesis